MKTTIITKNGSEVIDTENPRLIKGMPVYKSLVAYFENWINDEADAETRQMYFGSFEEFEGHSYLNWQGAIKDMFESLCQYIEETGKKVITTKDYCKIDFEGVLQY